MPVWDSGLIVNRGIARTEQVTVSLVNRGWRRQTVTLQIYTLEPDRTGPGCVHENERCTLPLESAGRSGSAWSWSANVSELPAFGVRIGAAGPGAQGLVVSALQFGADGQLLASRTL